MYDVAQLEPDGWTSPPLEGRLVDKEGLGTVCVGLGAVSLKGPQNAFLSALMAFRAAGKPLPINLVFVCEGEEEDSSPHLNEIVLHPDVLPELKKCSGMFMPQAGQDRDGGVEVMLGAKGLVELELISSSARWGHGASHDLHSARAAQVDSPAWRLVEALNSLVGPDGHTPAVQDFFELAKPLTPTQTRMVRDFAARVSENVTKQTLGVERWIDDKNWADSLIAYVAQPTINIQGLVAGYTGQGTKTILPSRATAKKTAAYCSQFPAMMPTLSPGPIPMDSSERARSRLWWLSSL
jgi:acetylornithine deacetylase/succinyl-diaminopimelate desuccinylase-like protein